MVWGAVTAAVANIAMGAISDRTRSRFGRRRPWIALGAVLTVLSYVGIWRSATPGQFVWAIIGFQLAFNVLMAPLSAVFAERVPLALRSTVSALMGLSYPLAVALGSSLMALGAAARAGAAGAAGRHSASRRRPVPDRFRRTRLERGSAEPSAPAGRGAGRGLRSVPIAQLRRRLDLPSADRDGIRPGQRLSALFHHRCGGVGRPHAGKRPRPADRRRLRRGRDRRRPGRPVRSAHPSSPARRLDRGGAPVRRDPRSGPDPVLDRRRGRLRRLWPGAGGLWLCRDGADGRRPAVAGEPGPRHGAEQSGGRPASGPGAPRRP